MNEWIRITFSRTGHALIVAGKGGVGKTTVAAALGLAASTAGVDTLLVDVESKRGLGSFFGLESVRYEPTSLVESSAEERRGSLSVRTIQPDDALTDYLGHHGLGGVTAGLRRMGVLDALAASTPGVRDLLIAGKIKQLVMAPDAPLVIVDTPSSGHALSLLRAASTLERLVSAGPIHTQAQEVNSLLTNPAKSQVVLVTMPEETPVNETIEMAFALEDEVGVALGPIVVNAVLARPDVSTRRSAAKAAMARVDSSGLLLDAAAQAAKYWIGRADAQRARIAALETALPLEQLVVHRHEAPRESQTSAGIDMLRAMAAELAAAITALRFQSAFEAESQR